MDTAFVTEAAKRGIFAYITDGDSAKIQSAIDIVLRRFADFHNLEGAFGRRAVIERAKASSWSATESPIKTVSICSAATRKPRDSRSSTSPRPSWTPTCSCLRARTRLVQGWDRLRE